jgi:hypothetical protein
MRRFGLVALSGILTFSLGAGAFGVDPPDASAKAFAAANDAWDRGDYTAALPEYIRLLNTSYGSAYFDQIALRTGELYQSTELTADGRNPKFSPDGRFLSFETGLEVSRRTKVIRNDGSQTVVADLPGVSAAFSPLGPAVAYLKIADGVEIRAAAQAVEGAGLTASNRTLLIQMLAWEVQRHSSIAIFDLNTRLERDLPAPELLKTGLAYAADGRAIYFVGRPETEEDRNDIYAISTTEPAAKPIVVGDAPRFKGSPIVDPGGRSLLHLVSGQDSLRRPPGAPPPAGVAPPATSPTAGPAPPPSFAIIDLATGKTTIVEGSSPALSADGKSLAYVVRTGTQSRLMLGPSVGGPMAAVKNTSGRFDAPALSADGSRVAYQAMLRDDWELYVANRDGGNEQRLTRDVQHDLLPQFVAGDRLLEVIGEARHRRSFLLDLKTGTQTRLFHNNTLRTIAPEYQWVVSQDGTRILIGAERDGNTISPERGVYLMDLTQKVTKTALLDRLETNLAGERALRVAQTRAFNPIATAVRGVVNRISATRIFNYEKALFDFDSKHISRPGNKLASEYLFNTYRSFGYEPEYQWFEQRTAVDGRTANVTATLRGTVNPELVYVISSHYDSVTAGPGADDDSSGTAALLEAARVLAGNPQPATIIFASFTGEEAGLLGSREFVRRAIAGNVRILGALNNDMIGWTNDAHLDNTIRYSNAGIRDIQHGAAMLFTRLITYDALYFKSTDAASYYDAYGDIVGGIGSYPVLSSPHYHQSHDLLEFENHDLIAETSKTTVATVMRLASSPSRIRNLKVTSYSDGVATLTWDPSPEKGIRSYVVSAEVPDGAAPLPAATRGAIVMLPRAVLKALPPGTVVSVKAVNMRGLESWDAARVSLGAPPSTAR